MPDSSKLVARIIVEDLPLYKDMAEFILTLARDDSLPLPLRSQALELCQRLLAMLQAKEKRITP